MRTTTKTQKTLLAGCTAAMSAMGLFITVPAPAHADDQPVCTEYTFTGRFDIQIEYDKGKKEDYAFASQKANYLMGTSGETDSTMYPFGEGSLLGEINGRLKGRIVDGRNVQMLFNPGDNYRYDGWVGDDRRVVDGKGWNTSTGDEFSWRSDTQLACARYQSAPVAEAPKAAPPPDGPASPKPGPKVEFLYDTPSFGMVTARVQDLSGEDSTCTYTATQPPATAAVASRTFPLKANDHSDQQFGPLAKLGISYRAVVDCGAGKVTTENPVY